MLTPKQLHNYQRKAIEHLDKHENAMVWLSLGLGKTISTLTNIVDRMDRMQVFGTLVVAPLRVVQTVWDQEALKWSHTKHLKFQLIHGNEESKVRALCLPTDIYLINYEGLTWLAQYIERVYKDKCLPFNMIVFDEVTKIKNAQSIRHEAIRSFLLRCPYRVGLTGTPAANGYKDLFGQYLGVDAGQRLGKYEDHFKDEFFNSSGYGGYTLELKKESKNAILERISDITLQMDSQDYLELPPVTYTNIVIPLTPKARKLYEQLENEFFMELDSGDRVEVANMAALSNKALQAANGGVYLMPGEPEWERVHDCKLNALDDVIEESGGNPILCFYSFQHDRIRILNKYKNAEFFKSGMSTKHIMDIVTRWNAGKIDLLVVHPASAGHGLNLQQALNSQIVWFGLNWSW